MFAFITWSCAKDDMIPSGESVPVDEIRLIEIAPSDIPDGVEPLQFKTREEFIEFIEDFFNADNAIILEPDSPIKTRDGWVPPVSGSTSKNVGRAGASSCVGTFTWWDPLGTIGVSSRLSGVVAFSYWQQTGGNATWVILQRYDMCQINYVIEGDYSVYAYIEGEGGPVLLFNDKYRFEGYTYVS